MANYKPVQNQVEPTAPDEADEEDGRDVWDKALDWAPTIGMFAGATAGGRWGRDDGHARAGLSAGWRADVVHVGRRRHHR